MINLSDYVTAIKGINCTSALSLEGVKITGAYVCDMLSDVMGSAKPGQVWITIMKHLNIIAVASMTGIPAIIFAKGNEPDTAVIEKGRDYTISSKLPTFELAGKLYKLLNP